MYTLTEISDKEGYTHFITFITLFTHFSTQILISFHTHFITQCVVHLIYLPAAHNEYYEFPCNVTEHNWIQVSHTCTHKPDI